MDGFLESGDMAKVSSNPNRLAVLEREGVQRIFALRGVSMVQYRDGFVFYELLPAELL